MQEPGRLLATEPWGRNKSKDQGKNQGMNTTGEMRARLGDESVYHVVQVRTLTLTWSDVGSRGPTFSDFGLKSITQKLRVSKAWGSSNKAIEMILC